MSLPVHADHPPSRRPKLADRLVETLSGQIHDRALQPGAQLPTELQLSAAYGVSRTVVREAIARLSADGLVEARQGAGVFVSGDLDGLLSETARKVSMALNVLEVRMAIEMESAALAAIRRSPSQAADIEAAFQDFEALLGSGQPTGAADFAFHRAVATATNNPFYVEILDVLGRRTIPRDLVTTLSAGLLRSDDYQKQLQAEHRAIMAAIAAGDTDAARNAMRAHLHESQRRYQSLLRSAAPVRPI